MTTKRKMIQRKNRLLDAMKATETISEVLAIEKKQATAMREFLERISEDFSYNHAFRQQVRVVLSQVGRDAGRDYVHKDRLLAAEKDANEEQDAAQLYFESWQRLRDHLLNLKVSHSHLVPDALLSDVPVRTGGCISRKQVKSMVEAISAVSDTPDLSILPGVQGENGKEYLVGVRRGLIIAENIALEHARTLGL